MKRGMVWCALVCLPAIAVAQSASEPWLSWTIERIEGLGAARVGGDYTHGSFSMANMQIKTLCDEAMTARLKWNPTVAVRVTVRPPGARAGDAGPSRMAELTCDEVRTNPNALADRIPPPRRPPPKTKDLIQLWD